MSEGDSALICNLYLSKKEVLDSLCREHLNYRYQPNYKDSIITQQQNGKLHIFLVLQDRPQEINSDGGGNAPVIGRIR